MRIVFGVGLIAFCVLRVAAIDGLVLAPEDVRIEQSIEGGYYIYVRSSPDIGSVLLTESTEAVDHAAATYALRNPDYHPENGDELRRLDGEFLDSDDNYSLIDSSPIADERFESAFRIFVPYVVDFGYDWSRSGSMQVLDGAYLSIRTFSLPYADYEGGYQDNPFVLRVFQETRLAEDTEHMAAAVDELAAVAEDNSGTTFRSDTDQGVVDRIAELLAAAPGDTIDLVLALDTTQSMEDNIPYLQASLVPMLERAAGDRELVRVGVVYYRDYMEEYLTRRFDFVGDVRSVQRAIDTIRVAGGRDTPEAVNEALYTAVTRFYWQADSRLVVLVGDAPPHPLPRGSITPEMVRDEAARNGVQIHTIILPQ